MTDNKSQSTSGILVQAISRIKAISFTPKKQPVRGCFHPGVSSISRENIQLTEKGPITGQEMIKAMLLYIWPKDDEAIRNRVSLAVGLLVGAKIMNVAVPFIFKYSVDYLNVGNTLNMNSAPETIVTVATSLLLGCK